MISICFFNTIPSWGGGEKWHFEMASYLKTLNYKVLFYTEKNGVLDKKLAVERIKTAHISLTNFSYLNQRKVKKVAKVLKENKIEIIILNSSQDLKFGGLAAKKANVKHIIYRRGSAIPIKNSFINRYFFSKILTGIIANSIATKKTINQNNERLFPKEKIIVIPNGIDTANFLDSHTQKPEVKNKIFTIGNLGRLVKQKHQIFLLEVAKELKRREIEFKLIIGGEGVLKEMLLQKRKEFNLENEVEFLGFINHPRTFMAQLDVFLLSSLWEGFGYVIAEALLCEKPVIAFDVSSNPELVINEENGFLIKTNDINDFTDKIIYLYHNKPLQKKLGKKGKEKIITEFDSSVSRKKIKDFIENLSNDNRN